ncbi:MAG TPA: sulfatase-like hydrolase/transferase [Pseudonocardiaceae bacterium]|nr:sulfatase-like hydrolase/transferase [Pseudonocardiaceae bacterium]
MPSRSRPNILIISTDQHRFDALGCYGNEIIQTPAIDGLAAQGTVFENCYAASPMCSPSRASLMTGLYPRNHGLWANGVAMSDHHRLLSRALADDGYDCGLVGKFHLAPADEGRTEHRFDDGFRMFEWAHDPVHPSPQNSYHRWLAEHHPETWAEYQKTTRPAWDAESGNQARGALFLDTVDPAAHYSTWVANRAVDFLGEDERSEDEPFFLIANFFDPHHPFGAPEEYIRRYRPDGVPAPVGSPAELTEKPEPQQGYSQTSYAGTAPGFQDYTADEIQDLIVRYYAMVSLVDDQVARILAALEKSGRAEDTLVVFTSDHGEMLGDHGMILKGPMMYEGAVRIPLILRWPGRIPAGGRAADLVQTIDVHGTVLAATGCRAMPGAQGGDLAALARGETPWRDFALVEYRDAGFPQDPPIHTTMLRRGDHKLVVWHGRPASDRKLDGELYDLAADPGEQHNLWADPAHAELRHELTDHLLDALVATEDRSRPRTSTW